MDMRLYQLIAIYWESKVEFYGRIPGIYHTLLYNLAYTERISGLFLHSYGMVVDCWSRVELPQAMDVVGFAWDVRSSHPSFVSILDF